MKRFSLLALLLLAGCGSSDLLNGGGGFNSPSGSAGGQAPGNAAPAGVMARMDPPATYTPPAQATLVSTNVSGVAANGYQHFLSLNYSGARLAFSSSSNNLVSGAGDSQATTATLSGESLNGINTNPPTGQRPFRLDVFVKDLNNGAVEWASRRTGTTGTADRESSYPILSEDGQKVIFRSWASLVPSLYSPPTTSRSCHIYERNLDTSATTMVDVTATQTVGSTHSIPMQYLDNRYVTMTSRSAQFDPSNTAGWDIAYRKDLQTGSLTRITHASRPSLGEKDVNLDMNLARFTSVVWTPGTSNYALWITDLLAGTTSLLQTRLHGTSDLSGARPLQAANQGVFYLRKETSTPTLCYLRYSDNTVTEISPKVYEFAVSKDGRYVVFNTSATLDVADTSGNQDVYVRNMQTGSVVLVNPPVTVSSGFWHTRPAISGDGRTIAWIRANWGVPLQRPIYLRANPLYTP